MRTGKIFLTLMPFWAPLNPPLGISLLKSCLINQGFHVNTYDFNTVDELMEVVDSYFKILGQIVPIHLRSNFRMIGFDVLSNHLVVFLHKTKENEYHELVKSLIRLNFFTNIDKHSVLALDKVISDFFDTLRKKLIQEFERVKPEIFGISTYSTTLGPSLFAFKLIKEKFPNVENIMGGGVFADQLALNSLNLSEFLKRTESYIDKLFISESEILLTRYLSGLLEKERRVFSLRDIDDENFDLSQAVIPDFGNLDLRAYSHMAIYASRSCPFQCGFCSETLQWGRFRKKSGEQVADEISRIKEKYGGKLFLFGDSMMNQVASELSQSLIRKGMDVYWDGYFRIDKTVGDACNIDLWKRAGLYRVRLGVESGSRDVLDLMNKKINPDLIKKVISSLARSGIKTTTYWVIGYPGETEEDFNETLKLLALLKNDIYEADWHPFYFFPKGQVQSEKWLQTHGMKLLYPEEFTHMLLTQTWELCMQPQREVIYERMIRFTEACKKLCIPNPYTIMDIYQADKRWKELHPETGPTILELHNYKFIKNSFLDDKR